MVEGIKLGQPYIMVYARKIGDDIFSGEPLIEFATLDRKADWRITQREYESLGKPRMIVCYNCRVGVCNPK